MNGAPRAGSDGCRDLCAVVVYQVSVYIKRRDISFHFPSRRFIGIGLHARGLHSTLERRAGVHLVRLFLRSKCIWFPSWEKR